MADQNTSNLGNIINSIERNQILLPDFQRDFVWRDEEKQKQLVASVLCKMPVGSILLLEADPDDYAANVIGCAKKEVNTSSMKGTASFLLDGQQRITVLTNVYSSVIHDNCPKVSELIAPAALKRRFFLKLPKWKNRPDPDEDWFGVGKLEFPMSNPTSDLPDFLTAQMMNYIHVESFNANDKKPFNPAEKLSTNLDTFCVGFQDGYLIPLFLMTKPINGTNKNTVTLRFQVIIETIANNIASEIKNQYKEYDSITEKHNFTDYIFGDEADEIKLHLDMEKAFFEAIDDRKVTWTSSLQDYLKSCVNNLSLHQIVVKASQRARAIDIYENLNRGGVCLNTFDLIMARVAKVSKENFNQRIKRLMKKEKSYPEKVLPDKVRIILASSIKAKTYNATMNMSCYNEQKNELNQKYVDIFLDVLGMYCYVPDLRPDDIKLDYIKKSSILNLTPEKIDKNCDIVIKAIDRALFFLQTRCGIRSLQEVNYSLVVALIAIVFLNDDYFFDTDVHMLLEGWYWAALFSGEYDKDQNSIFISNLKNMLLTVSKKTNCGWIDGIKNNVFNMTNFSDPDLVLMKKTNEDRYPKRVLTQFVCQFMLAQTYKDMFDSEKTISVFCDEASTLEAHHIIPLGSTKKIGEVTADLRNKPTHICNSPMNFVLITKKANKAISDDSLEVYINKITSEAKSKLFITGLLSGGSIDTEEKIYNILKNRFDMLKGIVSDKITDDLMNWR